jgi:hypothetical protein
MANGRSDDPMFAFHPGTRDEQLGDRRFDKTYPNNADGFQNPSDGGTDRFPRRDVVFPVLPPRTNGGADGMGAPPRRDKRRSRAQGQNVCAAINPAFSEALPTLSAQLAAWDTGPDQCGEESSTIMVFLKTYDFAENAVTGLGGGAVADPFAGVVSSVTPNLAILQSLEVLCNLQWGHDGVNQKIVANMPAGQIVKGSAFGTYCRANAKLTPRYYLRTRDADAGTTQVYSYFSPDANTRNNIFNSIDSPALNPQLGFDAGTVPTTPIHIEGIIGMGSSAISQGGSFDRSSRITRRFFGTFPDVGAYPATGAFVLCPVAFGASAVMLQALATPFTDPTGRVFSNLLMGMMDHSGNILIAELIPNTFFPIYADCAAIFVYNPANNTFENPFTLIYDLGL